jgi:hypothetical protein
MSGFDHARDQSECVEEKADSGDDESRLRYSLESTGELAKKERGPEEIEEKRDFEKQNVHLLVSPPNPKAFCLF